MFRHCVYSSENRNPTHIEVRSFVAVEVEKRGLDLGVVVGVCSLEKFVALRLAEGPSEDAEENYIYNIARLATHRERQHLPAKNQSEQV